MPIAGGDTIVPFHWQRTHQRGVIECRWKPWTRANVERLCGPLTGTDRTLPVLNRGGVPDRLSDLISEHNMVRKPDVTIADLGIPAANKSRVLRRPLASLVREITRVDDAMAMNPWPQGMFAR